MVLSELVEKQHFFSVTLARFITALSEKGYVVTFGEVYRDPEWAKVLAERAKKSGAAAISTSLHIDRLAADLVLRKHGMLLTDTEDYREAGLLWESYSVPKKHECAWGGRFRKPDGNHFSVAFRGRR